VPLKNFHGIAGLSMLLTLQVQSCASAESLLDEGTRFYRESNFEKAGRCFEAEIKTNPNNAKAHYLLGNIFFELNRHQDAAQEYRRAISIDAHGPVAQYSQQGLAAIEKFKAGGSTEAARGTAALQSRQENSETNAIQNSARRISAQTTETENHLSEECEARIRDTTHDAEKRIADLEKEMQEKIDSNGVAYRGRSGSYNPAPQNQVIRDDYQRLISAVKDEQNKKIAAIKLSYKERQMAAEDSAITLDKEYVDRKPGGNVKLAPSGTNVFVRSYETGGEASGNPVPIALPPAKTLPGLNSKKSSGVKLHENSTKSP
jgi:tetratricopeptide (TPR) repeat protein